MNLTDLLNALSTNSLPVTSVNSITVAPEDLEAVTASLNSHGILIVTTYDNATETLTVTRIQ